MSVNAVSIPVSAVERLTAEQRFNLDGLCASFAMERLEISDEAREIGARFLLKEISGDDMVRALDALDGLDLEQ